MTLREVREEILKYKLNALEHKNERISISWKKLGKWEKLLETIEINMIMNNKELENEKNVNRTI